METTHNRSASELMYQDRFSYMVEHGISQWGKTLHMQLLSLAETLFNLR